MRAAAYFASLPPQEREVVQLELRDLAARDLLPASFVLADLFDVSAMHLPPDFVFEDEPGLEWVECPDCEGRQWVEAGDDAQQCPRCWFGQVLAAAA